MSRIYEALQRADLERKTGSASEVESLAETVVTSDGEALPTTSVEFGFENIARHPWKPSASCLPSLTDRGAAVEQFRSLRSRVCQVRYEAPLKTILVSSGMPSEGKSFVAANLAMCLARDGANKILLIDADLRRPSLHSLLGAPNTPGLSEYLEGTAELIDILQRDSGSQAAENTSMGSVSNLTFIPSGKHRDNSSELLASHRIEELIAALTPHFDWIVIDSPPVLVVTDAVDLARAVDAVLLIAREAYTPFDVAQRAQAAFSKFRILGFVLSAVKHFEHKGYDSSYYYGEQEAGHKAKRGKDKRSRT